MVSNGIRPWWWFWWWTWLLLWVPWWWWLLLWWLRLFWFEQTRELLLLILLWRIVVWLALLCCNCWANFICASVCWLPQFFLLVTFFQESAFRNSECFLNGWVIDEWWWLFRCWCNWLWVKIISGGLWLEREMAGSLVVDPLGEKLRTVPIISERLSSASEFNAGAKRVRDSSSGNSKSESSSDESSDIVLHFLLNSFLKSPLNLGDLWDRLLLLSSSSMSQNWGEGSGGGESVITLTCWLRFWL